MVVPETESKCVKSSALLIWATTLSSLKQNIYSPVLEQHQLPFLLLVYKGTHLPEKTIIHFFLLAFE